MCIFFSKISSGEDGALFFVFLPPDFTMNDDEGTMNDDEGTMNDDE